uniref:Uncharacterized protein n=1 Tax=Parascaris univalens TaxID=6257 RepID=A0A915BFT6_PARUN
MCGCLCTRVCKLCTRVLICAFAVCVLEEMQVCVCVPAYIPSGAGPREPREGIAQPIDRSTSKLAAKPQPSLISSQIDQSAIVHLQNLFSQFQRQYNQFVNVNQRRLGVVMCLCIAYGSAAITAAERLVATKFTHKYFLRNGKPRTVYDAHQVLLALTQRVTAINGAVRNHANQLSQMGDKALATATLRTESNLNLFNEQVAQLKKALDAEVAQRAKESEVQAEKIARLQDYVRNVDMQDSEALQKLCRGRERIADETKKLERTGVVVANTTSECGVRINEALKAETRARLEFEEEFKRTWSDSVNDYLKSVEEADRSIYKEQFAKINEALAALETHLEAGNTKIDKIITADVQSRRAHERGLLARAKELDDRVTKYILALKQTIDDFNASKRNVKLPTFDIDSVRREMESIAADKNKISMEGLLKLEEKMSGIQEAFMREKRDILSKVQSANEVERFEKLRTQFDKLNEIKDSMQSANEQLRDKIERQVPKDVRLQYSCGHPWALVGMMDVLEGGEGEVSLKLSDSDLENSGSQNGFKF